MKPSSIQNNHYYKHLNQKSFALCILLLIPFIGNIVARQWEFIDKKSKVNASGPIQTKIDVTPPPEESEEIDAAFQEVIDATPRIEKDFTTKKTIEEQRQAHKNAKNFLKKELGKIGARVDFISHSIKGAPNFKDVVIKPELLDPTVFNSQYTTGVRGDIIRSGKRSKGTVVVYGGASQFNGCEAVIPATLPPGEAYEAYKKDKTQGPESQLAFSPKQVEIINCGGNLGLNGLSSTLSKTTKAEITHGYFTPCQKKAERVIQQLIDKGSCIEYPCIGNIPLGGKEVVYLILVAAPAFGLYAKKNSAKGAQQSQIEFLCALHAYRAQFAACVKLAKETHQPVNFKATATGLGVFGNSPIHLAQAFYWAALEYQDDLRDNQVTVTLQIFKSPGASPNQNANQMAAMLGLVNI